MKTERAVSLLLSKQEAKQLMNIMGYNMTIPDVLERAGESRRAVTAFMSRIHTELRDALENR